jgi:hypothetical protein
MEHYISLYIDDELGLEEKMDFLERVHADPTYKDEALSLLGLQKILCQGLVVKPPKPLSTMPPRAISFHRIGLALAATLFCVFAFLAGSALNTNHDTEALITAQLERVKEYRFVIYLEDTESVEIVGSFNNWQKTPLTRKGDSGYWEAVITLPQGEHRYSFLVNGKIPLPDPTVAAKEMDDFGTLNSILDV